MLKSLTHIHTNTSSAWRQKDLTGYCFNYIDRPFCLRTDDMELCVLDSKADPGFTPSKMGVRGGGGNKWSWEVWLENFAPKPPSFPRGKR